MPRHRRFRSFLCPEVVKGRFLKNFLTKQQLRMPKINKVFELDVSPQKYVDACDEDELRELIMLAQDRLVRLHKDDVKEPVLLETNQPIKSLGI